MSRILIVDDEENVLKALRRALLIPAPNAAPLASPPTIDIFTDAEEALNKASFTTYHLVLSDFRMPRMNGVQFLTAFRSIQPNAARIILSGHADMGVLVDAVNEAGISRFIAKPWNDDELRATVAQLLLDHEETMENQRLADQARLAHGALTEEEIERRLLEAEEPGITHVDWGPDGSVLLDPTLADDPEASEEAPGKASGRRH